MANFKKDNEFGKIAESKVKELLIKRKHKVVDISDNYTAGDLLVDNLVVEVKHQRCIAYNELFIELYTPTNAYGWFFKDQKVDYYCFYYNNYYLFISKNGLHKYFVDEFPEFFTKNYLFKYDSQGFVYEKIKIDKLIDYLNINELFYQIIEDNNNIF